MTIDFFLQSLAEVDLEINDAIKLDKYTNNINEKANLIAWFLSKIMLLEIKITTTNGTMKINNSWIVRLTEYKIDLKFNGI